MSFIIGRSAFRAMRTFRRPFGVNAGEPFSLKVKHIHTENSEGERALKKGAQRDPELYVLYAIMVAAMAGAGWYISGFALNRIHEQVDVAQAPKSEPWKRDIADRGK